MKTNKNFVLRQVADTWIILPVGEATVDFHGMMTINETGVFLWRMMEQGCEKAALSEALVKEYEVEYSRAQEDVESFLSRLKKVGCIDE